MDKRCAELKRYNGRLNGIGRFIGDKLVVGPLAEGSAAYRHHGHQARRLARRSYWRGTDPGTRGTEVWKKNRFASQLARRSERSGRCFAFTANWNATSAASMIAPPIACSGVIAARRAAAH